MSIFLWELPRFGHSRLVLTKYFEVDFAAYCFRKAVCHFRGVTFTGSEVETEVIMAVVTALFIIMGKWTGRNVIVNKTLNPPGSLNTLLKKLEMVFYDKCSFLSLWFTYLFQMSLPFYTVTFLKNNIPSCHSHTLILTVCEFFSGSLLNITVIWLISVLLLYLFLTPWKLTPRILLFFQSCLSGGRQWRALTNGPWSCSQPHCILGHTWSQSCTGQ